MKFYRILIVIVTIVFITFVGRNVITDYLDRLLPYISRYIPLEDYFLNRYIYKRKVNALLVDYSVINIDMEAVFIGDSHIQNFDLKTNFPNYNVVNMGVANDTTKGLLLRLNGLPKSRAYMLFVMIGYNDLRYRKPAEITRNYRQALNTIQERFEIPNESIYVLSLLPVSVEKRNKNKKIMILNAEIRSMTNEMGLNILDIYSSFIDDHDSIQLEYFVDGVHLNSKGYSLLTKIIDQEIN